MLKKAIMAAATLATLAAIPATAQDYNAAPNYGTRVVRTGFMPDPRTVAVRAGGNISAEEAVGSHCRGYITNRPDVRVIYRAGDELPLILSVNSREDTTLIVNAPDGRWYCDDDSGNRGMNPSIRFRRPMSGRYEVWVGTYRPGPSAAARLHISELYSQ
jgi:hypothetical protein